MKNPAPKDQPETYCPFIYPVKDNKKLSHFTESRNMEFMEVLLSRRSANIFDRITLSEISELLYLTTKIQSIEIDGSNFILTKRTTPSAGARHPIDLIVSLPTTPLINRILSYYNPLDHSLSELSIVESSLQDFFKEININLPIKDACIIWFSIQTTKTSTKYWNPESLYWKDTGALLYCFQMVSTYLGLKSCPLGTLAEHSFHDVFRTNDLISGGGILIGK